jgi:hypothetical protein
MPAQNLALPEATFGRDEVVVHCQRSDLAAVAETLTVLLYSVDVDAPLEERLPRPAAERLFADTRDHGERWPAIVGAELVGPDGDVLDRW